MAAEPRWWHRWRVQGHLTPMVTGGAEHAYAPRFFVRRSAAEAFQFRLRRDHGPGMVGSVCRPITPADRGEPWPLFCHGPRWFRIKGWGVRYVDHRKSPPLFSERYGHRRGLHIGPHCLMWIKPHPRPACRIVPGEPT